MSETRARRSRAAGAVTKARGFQAGSATAGIKESGRPDLALLVSEQPAIAAAMFTRNVVQAAPLLVDQEHLRNQRIRAVLVNSGNANAATGERGLRDAREMARLAAAHVGCAPTDVFVMSTGIIGQYLPMERLAAGIPRLKISQRGGAAFARAILTTDTYVKEAAATFEANGETYTLGGCAKGAGMIHPNMATLLAFLTTDAPIAGPVLQHRLHHVVDRTFNMVTVDGDTSTNDAVLLLASGAGGGAVIDHNHAAAVAAFDRALARVCTLLATDIARDGEGATRRIDVTVSGAPTWEAGREIARSVVRSPLLKAALSKGDPNWGRVLMAAGNAGVPFDPGRCRLWLGRHLLFDRGAPTEVPESRPAKAAQRDPVVIRLDLDAGEASATAWGCDLTEAYVRFNADYVT